MATTTITDRMAQVALDKLQDELRDAISQEKPFLHISPVSQRLILRGLTALQGERSYQRTVGETAARIHAEISG